MATPEYICSLDTASIKKAKDELNEVPEDRLAAVQAFRDWIKEQPHIRCPDTGTVFLLRFLRWAKFSQIRAREKLEQYLNLRKALPKVFPDMDPTETAFIELTKTGLSFPLPKRDKNGCTLMFGRINSDLLKIITKYGPLYSYRAGIIMMEYMTRSESCQVNGIVGFSDFGDFSGSMITKFMTPEVRKCEEEFWKSMPVRFKKFHAYKIGLIFETMFAFFKPVIPKKMHGRFALHDTMTTVYEDIPMECIPREYLPDDYTGPCVGSMDECIDKYLLDIQQKDIIRELKFRSSDAFGIDLSKKPMEEVTHFRKLNVD